MAAMAVHEKKSQKSRPQSDLDDDTPRRRQLDGSEAQLEKVLFRADEDTASEYLKDLITASGLKDAWGEMAKKFRAVQAQHSQLLSLASREALNRDFVTRPEFRITVQEEHYRLLQDHTKRLAALELEVAEEKQARLQLEDSVSQLASHTEDELKNLKPEVAAAHGWLEALDARCQEQNTQVLRAQQDLQQQLNSREKKLREESLKLAKALEGEVVERKVLGGEVKRQKEFLSGEAFRKHMEETCNKALENYVHKDVMMTEVQNSTEHMCQPLRVLIQNLEKSFKDLGIELRRKDAYLEQCLENTDIRLQNKDEFLNERINAVMDELPEKATAVALDDLKGKLIYHVDILENLHARLQKEATHKVQEVVTRLSEFQVILQDHEHALQHAAEEILHRGTKYDVAVLTERVDRCAGKEKVESEIKEIRESLAWQSTKIESAQFHSGLGGHTHSRSASRARSILPRSIAGGNLSRSSSINSEAFGKSLSLKQSTAAPVSQLSESSTVKFSEEEKDEEGQDSTIKFSIPKVPKMAEPIEEESLPSEPSRSNTATNAGREVGEDDNESTGSARNDPLRNLLGMSAQPELEEAVIEQQEQLVQLQDQLAELLQGSALGASTLTELLQQQLECLAQGVFCLGKVCLRKPGSNAGSLLARQEHSLELLVHLRSVMHWVTHRQRPSEWEPSALTTIALQSMKIPDHEAHSTPQISSRQRESQPMPSLRRGKALTSSPREASPSERRPFATGGSGWRQRGLPANCTYDDVKRPSTSGAVMVNSKPDGRSLMVSPGRKREDAEPETREPFPPEPSVDDSLSLPPLHESRSGSKESVASVKSRGNRTSRAPS